MKIERPREFKIFVQEVESGIPHILCLSNALYDEDEVKQHGVIYTTIDKTAYDKAIDELKSVLDYRPSHFIEHDNAQDIIFSIEQTLKDLGEL